MSLPLTTRNATLDDLAKLLQDQHARKLDVVAPASAIRADSGALVLSGTEADLSLDGVTSTDGTYVPTVVADEGIAEKLGVPSAYLKRLQADRPDLYDANVNGWLHGSGSDDTCHACSAPAGELHRKGCADRPDPRKFLVRCFRGDDGPGVARAFLSDSYRIVDHLDVLTAVLDGIKDAGVAVNIDSCDLSDRRMFVRVVAPEVTALAPVLLSGYRNPFNDPAVERAANHGWDLGRAREAAAREGAAYGPGDEPIVFAGFVVSNSEVGGGALSIVPRLMVKVCKNGLVITKDALRHVHLGSRLDEGVVRWSDETQRKSLDLISSKARDAVATFLDVDFMTKVLARVEEQAAVELDEPAKVVEVVGKQLKFTPERIAGVLDHFIRCAQPTAGGVLNAVTSYAQTIPDADEAAAVESQGLRALELAATR